MVIPERKASLRVPFVGKPLLQLDRSEKHNEGIDQEAEELQMISSNPLSFLKINVRVAQAMCNPTFSEYHNV